MTGHRRLVLPPLLALSLSFTAWASGTVVPRLSDKAVVSLVSMWPGKAIYIAFGHSAVRVRDESLGIDEIFNYGTFDFEDPLFVPRFVYGDLNYYLVHYPYRAYYDFNMVQEPRHWFEQELDLDRDQAQAVFAFLVNNARRENRYYRYDFIMDNCATRIKDAFASSLGESARFPDETPLGTGFTFRSLIDEYVADRPLYQFGFYLVLGMAADKPVTTHEATFLPHYLMRFTDRIALVSEDGSKRPFVRASRVLFDPDPPPVLGTPYANPAFALWPLALVSGTWILVAFAKRRKPGPRRPYVRFLDASLFAISGLAGLLIAYLSFFSWHTATKGNLNVLWLLPFHVAAAFFAARRERPKPVAVYFAVSAMLPLLPIAAFAFWPQAIHPTMIPYMLILTFRSLRVALEPKTGKGRPESRR